MQDVLFVGLTFAIFAVGVLYVRACMALKGESNGN